MNTLRKIMLTLLLVSFCIAPLHADVDTKEKRVMQIAILLDTSNSMDGLIHQAKTQIWKIINELALAKRNGVAPHLEVALYEYGKSSLSGEEGFLRMVLNLTTDLDKVSEELFALKTNGGQEYCGWVIQSALKELKWSASPDDFKAIFIAGNEPFTQGPVFYKEVCQASIQRGIVVNTIHCGNYNVGIQGMWQDAAELADGSYMHIDQNMREVVIKAPQDNDIMELNRSLNDTYIPFGRAGQESKMRQEAQDSNAAGSSYSGNINRALSKSSRHYRNDSWDLVDASKDNEKMLDDVEEEALPENMQSMSKEERKKYVEEMSAKRKAIQEKMQVLQDARKKYVAAERKKLAEKGEDSLDVAIIKALRKQMVERGYSFEK